MRNSQVISAMIGAIGALFTSLFGGWDTGMTTLIIFMAIDYLAGLVVAGVFKQSQKSDSGALESRAGWKGLCKKGMSLLFVLIAYRLDLMIGTDYIRDAVFSLVDILDLGQIEIAIRFASILKFQSLINEHGNRC